MTLGILGGGQLARMLCLDARRMGFRTVVWSGTSTAEPTEGVADVLIKKGFDDDVARAEFCGQVDVAKDSEKDAILALAKADANVQRHLEGKTVRKEIVVPNKLVNIVVG